MPLDNAPQLRLLVLVSQSQDSKHVMGLAGKCRRLEQRRDGDRPKGELLRSDLGIGSFKAQQKRPESIQTV